MKRTIFDLIKERAVLFDGGMGTELMRHGLPIGTCPETWNVERPDIVQKVHASYFEAGSDAVSTNSFGGNRIKLAAHGLEGRVRELNSAAARVARRAAPEGKYVAGSMGPTGKFLQPQGEFTEVEFEEVYGEQAGALAEGGVDLLIIETQYDLKEALAALRGAMRAAPSLPVFVTLTFNKFPRGYFTLMGNTVPLSVDALEKEGALALGANCTLNSEEMVGLIRAFREATKLPVIAQANAGKPALSGDGQVSYSQGLEDYVRFIPGMLKAGANVIGGCCGTDPGYIRKMAEFILR
jgi:5-methyltetrahydrofolate--homocysteine methyltransferase